MPVIDQDTLDTARRVSKAFQDVRLEMRALLTPGRNRCGEVSKAELERVADLIPEPHKMIILAEVFAREDGKPEPEWDGVPLFSDEVIAAVGSLEVRSKALWSGLCAAAAPVLNAARSSADQDELRNLAECFADPYHKRTIDMMLAAHIGKVDDMSAEAIPAGITTVEDDDQGQQPRFSI
jgi:hypothetical protein